MELVLPGPEYAESFAEALQEYKRDPGYHIEAVRNPMAPDRPPPELPDAVPYTTLWLVENGKYLGTFAIRHELNERLEKEGGHISYEIRPSERGRGLSKSGLKLCLKEARKLGIREALLTCTEEGVFSIRTLRSVMAETGGRELEPLEIRGKREFRFLLET